MDEKTMLRSYNNILVDDKEVSKYDNPKISDEKLDEIKQRVKHSLLKVNFENGMIQIKKEFTSDEAIQNVVWGVAAKTVGVQILTSSIVWSDVGRNTILILTNKRLFIAYANIYHEILKYKSYYFEEINEIKDTKRKDRNTVNILPSNGDIHEIYFSNNNYLKILLHLNENGVKIINTKEALRKVTIRAVLWSICISYTLFVFFSFISHYILHIK